MNESTDSDPGLFESHPRTFEANRYVYPVLSRRAGGISIGVNVNADQSCNFDCGYCQVRRTDRCPKEPIDLGRLRDELDRAVGLAASGRIFDGPPFHNVPESLRRLNDIALSGDGEPTLLKNLDEVVAIMAEIRQRRSLDDMKLVLITNATLLHRDHVRRALDILDRNNGEIWAKLDAGTEEHYRKVNRSGASFQQILGNLRETAQVHPIVIQSLFARLHDEPPGAAEIDAYCDRLRGITAGGGRIKLVQVHSVARVPAESWVTALPNEQIDAIAKKVRGATGLDVAAFHA